MEKSEKDSIQFKQTIEGNGGFSLQILTRGCSQVNDQGLGAFLKHLGIAHQVPEDLDDPEDEAKCLGIPGTVGKGILVNQIHQDLRYYLAKKEKWEKAEASIEGTLEESIANQKQIEWNRGAIYALLKVLDSIMEPRTEDQVGGVQ